MLVQFQKLTLSITMLSILLCFCFDFIVISEKKIIQIRLKRKESMEVSEKLGVNVISKNTEWIFLLQQKIRKKN